MRPLGLSGNANGFVAGAGVALATTARAMAASADALDLGDAGQAIAALAVFGVLLFVLGKWAWKPIVAQLRDREEEIAATLARSEQRETEAQDLLKHYRSRLDRAETEADALVAQAREQAESAGEDIVETARQEARGAAEEARRDIARAKQDAMAEMQQETARLAADLAGRVLNKQLDEAEHRRLLSDSLQEIRDELAKDRS
ncbi:MAG: F0F1 ATP synthase subunit B [Planctomycetota bacterium]|jgi:F-type H+-transporting ATPase subunit b